MHQYFSAYQNLSSIKDAPSSDLATSIFGGYALLTVLVPLMIGLILILALIMAFTLSSISRKLSEVIDIMDEQSPIENDSKEDIDSSRVKSRDLSNSVTMASLGICLGIALLGLGYVVEHEFWTIVLYVLGAVSVAVCVMVLAAELRAVKDKKTIIDSAAEDSKTSKVDDKSQP